MEFSWWDFQAVRVYMASAKVLNFGEPSLHNPASANPFREWALARSFLAHKKAMFSDGISL